MFADVIPTDCISLLSVMQTLLLYLVLWPICDTLHVLTVQSLWNRLKENALNVTVVLFSVFQLGFRQWYPRVPQDR